jgi:ABC-type sugar transport system ATPase subunit
MADRRLEAAQLVENRTIQGAGMTLDEGDSRPAVAINDVGKSFGATHALKSVTMEVRAGTVHALVGENGAGKSTALGCLAGRIAPTTGTVMIFGEELRYGDPRASRRAGVVAIYQELTIVPALSAEANVFLGQTRHQAGFLAERQMRRRYLELCDRMKVKPVPPHTLAGSLSVADQQVLEILRALDSEARVLLFDEPTAALAASERQALYGLIKGLRDSGVTIVFVSHNLDEVLDLADDITVFRDGRLTATASRSSFTKASLVQEMVGREGDDRVIHELLEDDEREAAHAEGEAKRKARLSRSAGRPALLQADGITVPGAVDDLELEVRAGEMVGVGGLVGSGRSTLLRALAGLEPSARGRLFLDGREVSWPRSVRQALGYGIALVPEDRKSQGLVLPMSSIDNIALSGFRSASRWGFISARMVEQATAGTAREFGFQAERLHHAARQLSGGNQQKLLLARWKHRTPKILLADEPTRGIDVGAKAEILRSLEEMADNGLGLVMVSSELEEVALVSDRVFVLAEGLMAGTLDRSTAQITVSDILHLAFRSRDVA